MNCQLIVGLIRGGGVLIGWSIFSSRHGATVTILTQLHWTATIVATNYVSAWDYLHCCSFLLVNFELFFPLRRLFYCYRNAALLLLVGTVLTGGVLMLVNGSVEAPRNVANFNWWTFLIWNDEFWLVGWTTERGFTQFTIKTGQWTVSEQRNRHDQTLIIV